MFHPTQMSWKDTGLLVIDVQEKLMAKIPRTAEIVRNIAFLSDAAKVLGMPAQATEQYPKGLGGSVAEVVQRYPERPEKVGFSCSRDSPRSWRSSAPLPDRKSCSLASRRTSACCTPRSICWRSTSACTLPRTPSAAATMWIGKPALKRMARAGCILVTSEMAAFEWVGGADHPQFKAISGLVQQRMKGTWSRRMTNDQ